jgi:hypothetical protein
VAGAGQRRTKYGLLHQGSVITVADMDRFVPALVRVLSDQARAWAPPLTMQDDARELANERYAEDAWLRKKD